MALLSGPDAFPLYCARLLQLCLTLWDSLDCSPTGSSVHEILQVQILEWVAMFSSRRSSQPRDWTCISYVSCIGRQFFTTSAIWEARFPHRDTLLGSLSWTFPNPPPLVISIHTELSMAVWQAGNLRTASLGQSPVIFINRKIKQNHCSGKIIWYKFLPLIAALVTLSIWTFEKTHV